MENDEAVKKSGYLGQSNMFWVIVAFVVILLMVLLFTKSSGDNSNMSDSANSSGPKKDDKTPVATRAAPYNLNNMMRNRGAATTSEM